MKKALRNTVALLGLAGTAMTTPASETEALSVDYPFSAAFSEFEISHPERSLTGWIWYPTNDESTSEPAFEKAIWEPVFAQKNATPAEGRFPLVLVSHGMYGLIYNQAWLAEQLAKAGFAVAAVNHPGTTTFDRSPDQSRRLWERPRDLSRTLDYLLQHSQWSEHLDAQRVAAVGHSLGGLTVMRLAGGVSDYANIRQQCTHPEFKFICDTLKVLNIAQHEEDAEMLLRSNRDERIRAIVSLDLGGTQTLTPESIKAVSVPVMVIGSSRADQLDQSIESDALAALLPADLLTRFSVEDTGHFDFLGVCTESGLEILQREVPEDAFVCEKGTHERAHKHQVYAEAIRDFLDEALAGQ